MLSYANPIQTTPQEEGTELGLKLSSNLNAAEEYSLNKSAGEAQASCKVLPTKNKQLEVIVLPYICMCICM